MTQDELIECLGSFFPGTFSHSAGFPASEHGKFFMDRLLRMPIEAITKTHFNQLLHLAHEAGVTDGFFKYYFLTVPREHPYTLPAVPGLNESGVSSLEQLRWGIRRFFVDALLYFTDVRTAYRELRVMDEEAIRSFFSARRFDSERMRARGPVLPFRPIPADDRYLIAEIACKAYSPIGDGSVPLIESVLLESYRTRGGGRLRVKDLFDAETGIGKTDPHAQMMLEFTALHRNL